ncbi:MAG: BON domain-containing protein [Chloroflexales bacterium]|nr:BON domain-containing protein [Chloroflexales bacterium]
MTDRNPTPRDRETPSGDSGAAAGAPDTGLNLDEGRVQFAPREADAGGPYAGRGPRGLSPADDAIGAQVCALMTEEGWIDASDIEVHVYEGAVTLEGTVESHEACRLAENIARAVSTVREVHNQLRVREPGDAATPGAQRALGAE